MVDHLAAPSAQIPFWLEVTQPIATTTGVLVALAVALWNVSQNRAERKDRSLQLAALDRAEQDRISAQARKVVPTLVRATVFGPDMWSIKVSNHSNAVVTELHVDVEGDDESGNPIENSCTPANGKIGTSEVFRRVIGEALSGSINAAVSRAQAPYGGWSGLSGMSTSRIGALASQQLAPQISQALQEALNGQLATHWPTALTPEQQAVMAYSASDNAKSIKVRITFTDEAGYRWTRTDKSGPRRIEKEA
ncbi:hypothetical protein CATRI_04300 [Corynebacterium atrinae]|uniref:hypothetical protein n=1 Tax=Corynebacterium atrinae TaxID=1336740 RepID=UPI0025B2F091|nr:hypothetical protein [Corynebacterium atrinae]WJY62956.1 hypothetical protein CATRI_04300 [Corynebacterium atrinae]